jgi:hypothetical protein
MTYSSSTLDVDFRFARDPMSRAEIGLLQAGTPQNFNHKMKDFFGNPDVKSYMRANKVDPRLIDMVINLQDRRKAWDYYEDGDRIFKEARLFQIPRDSVRKSIEGIPLFHQTPSN